MDDYLPISALQHIAYCPRQFALIHVEQAWEDNRYNSFYEVAPHAGAWIETLCPIIPTLWCCRRAPRGRVD